MLAGNETDAHEHGTPPNAKCSHPQVLQLAASRIRLDLAQVVKRGYPDVNVSRRPALLDRLTG